MGEPEHSSAFGDVVLRQPTGRARGLSTPGGDHQNAALLLQTPEVPVERIPRRGLMVIGGENIAPRRVDVMSGLELGQIAPHPP